MFERLQAAGAPVRFRFNGKEITAQPGDTVAAALLAADVRIFRSTPVSGAARGPFCMMGACFDCLVEIGGETVQACMTPVSPGLEVRSPRSPGDNK